MFQALKMNPRYYKPGFKWLEQSQKQLPLTCKDYGRMEGCCRPDCRELHVCPRFLLGRCTYTRCGKSHVLATPWNLRLLIPQGWRSPGELALALDLLQRRARSRAVSVCFMYNVGCCTAADCARLHVCYRHVVDRCPLDDCQLGHSLLASARNVELLTSAGLADTSISQLMGRLQEQVRRQPPLPAICNSAYTRQGCQRHCLRLHVCQAHVRGNCKYGHKCYRGHSLTEGPHNQRVLKFFGWTEEQALLLLRRSSGAASSSPAVNAAMADNGDDEEGAGAQNLAGEQIDTDTGAEAVVKAGDDAVEKGSQVGIHQERSHGRQKATPELKMEQRDWQCNEDEWKRKEDEWKCRENEWKRKEDEWKCREDELKCKEDEWKCKEKDWKRLEKEWQEKEKEWESREQKYLQNEKKWQRKMETLTEKQKTEQEERERREEQAMKQREQERIDRERDNEARRQEMAESKARHLDLEKEHARLMTNYTANEKTLTTIKRMNCELEQQLESLRMLLQESTSQQNTLEDVERLREQIRRHRECVECSVCLGVFTNPVTLGCSHTFCRGCIEEAGRGRLVHAHGAQARQCPLCRQVTSALVPCLALESLARALPEEAPERRQPEERGAAGGYGGGHYPPPVPPHNRPAQQRITFFEDF